MIIVIMIVIMIMMIIIIIVLVIVTIWLRTNGVNTNGAAAEAIIFVRLGKKGRTGTVGKIK